MYIKKILTSLCAVSIAATINVSAINYPHSFYDPEVGSGLAEWF